MRQNASRRKMNQQEETCEEEVKEKEEVSKSE